VKLVEKGFKQCGGQSILRNDTAPSHIACVFRRNFRKQLLTHGRPRAITANEQVAGFLATILESCRDFALSGIEVYELETRVVIVVGKPASQAVEQRTPRSHELLAVARRGNAAVFV